MFLEVAFLGEIVKTSITFFSKKGAWGPSSNINMLL